MEKSDFFTKNRATFTAERSLCRLFASWFGFTACQLLKNGEFAGLEYAQGMDFRYLLACVGMFFVIFSCVHIRLQKYETDTWFLLAGTAVCAARWLRVCNSIFFAIAVTVVLCLPMIYAVRKNKALLASWQPKSRTVWASALTLGALSCFVIGAIGCYRYLTFSSPNFDFGVFVNMFHNMKQTGIPLCTCERDVLLSHFAVHLSPIYYVLLPFYMVFPSPLTLQIGQAVILTSGVIPVVLLCKHFRISGKVTVLLAAIYCLYPALSTGCFYDIHENCFLTPLLLWMFWFFEKENRWGVYAFAALTLLVKEDAAIYVILFGVYVLLAKKQYRLGTYLLIGAAVYFVIALAVLRNSSARYAELYANNTPNPSIGGPMIDRYNNVIYNAEDGLMGAIKTSLINPGYLLTQLLSTPENGWGKLSYVIQMFLPLGFIPFFAKKPSRWLLLTPILLNLITNYLYQYDLGFQYHFGVSAFLIYATIGNVQQLQWPFRRNVLCFALVACVCLYVASVLPTLRNNHKNWEDHRGQYMQMEKILDTVPRDASVCCDTFLLPHLADRAEIYELYYHNNVGDVDYVIFDARYGVNQEQLQAFTDQGYMVREEYAGMLLILQKGVDNGG